VAVERVFKLKRRRPDKPLIVLIKSLSWLGSFFSLRDLPPAAERLLRFKKPVSVALPVRGFEWISRSSGLIAFRLVKGGFIGDLLARYGRPLVAPSANWEGYPPASDAFEALGYFGSGVSLYYEGGKRRGEPSAVVLFKGDRPKLIRRGALSEEELKELFKT